MKPTDNISKIAEKPLDKNEVKEEKSKISKKIFINIDNEEEEDKELIDLLNGKSKFL